MNKAKNSRFMTQEDQKNPIQRLDNLANRRAKPIVSDTNLATFVQKLVWPGLLETVSATKTGSCVIPDAMKRHENANV